MVKSLSDIKDHRWVVGKFFSNVKQMQSILIDGTVDSWKGITESLSSVR